MKMHHTNQNLKTLHTKFKDVRPFSPACPAGTGSRGNQNSDLAQSFPLFGALPVDVQNMVWKNAKKKPCVTISNGVNIPDHGEGRTIRVYITQSPYFQPIPDAPIAGRKPVPPGRYEYRWRLRTSEAPCKLDFISRNTWEEYQRRFPHRLELRDDPKSEVVRFDANRDTIAMDISSLFALSDYATPIGEPGVGGQRYGHGPPEPTRELKLIGFENIQRLAIPMADHPQRQGLDWLIKNVFTGIHSSIPGVDTLREDEAPHPGSDSRPSITEGLRLQDLRLNTRRDRRDLRRTTHWGLRDLFLLQLQNIFKVDGFSQLPLYTVEFVAEYRNEASNRKAAAWEFFKRLPNPGYGKEEDDKDGPEPELPCRGPEAPPSGTLLERYNGLYREFYDRSDSNDNEFSDPEYDEDGMAESKGEPTRRRHHYGVACRAWGKREQKEREEFCEIFEEAYEKLRSSAGERPFSAAAALNINFQCDRWRKLFGFANWFVYLPVLNEEGDPQDVAWERYFVKTNIEWVTSVANQDDDCEDVHKRVEKQAAIIVLRWHEYTEKHKPILQELHLIGKQLKYPHNPAKWVIKDDYSI
ncbi:hypothetical protein ONS95_011840 [Cadophora gregata]|uniref:uncharacterized protein n=1 Tax=Cadophora gregata TaxID=51156 RepID=UPI0026DCFFB7|nr:uncharacterized protein ONS95_011840 [Cadophora gregata]KAK0117500.1 hypothetical protein ONS95_011840 [Cadophora gregata]